jgi:flagellar motor switch protein FliM
MQPYDLTSQSKIVRGGMPLLNITNEKFAVMFRKTLSSLLRRVVAVNTSSVNLLKYEDFLKTLPLPSSLHVFKMDPLKGNMLLIAESRFVFTLVDFLFGGTGKDTYKIEGREFTHIENNLIKKIILNALSDFEKVWKTIFKINVIYKRSEINPQFVQIAAPNDLVAVVNFEVEMEYSSGGMTICMPYSSLEPVREKLQGSYQSDKLEADQEWADRFQEDIQLSDIDLVTELGRTELTGKEILNLKKGDVIPLDQYSGDDLNIYVEKHLKFKGQPGIYKGNQAVQISQIIFEEEVNDHGTE